MPLQGPRPVQKGSHDHSPSGGGGGSSGRNNQPTFPKPYELIPFPRQSPKLEKPAGHAKFHTDRLHGTLFLTLMVQTAVHVSTGTIALGSDVGVRGIPLVKTMTITPDQKLKIQGSSLKGCIRAMYEAITNSTLAVITGRYKQQIPQDRHPCRKKEQLCPASQVFGALDWQGLVEFSDAVATTIGSSSGSLPALFRPRPDQRRDYFQNGKAAGRKFYYSQTEALDAGNRGTPTQQAAKKSAFKTQIHFKNLTPAELGTLLTVLGQDPKYPMLLKLGGGKPVGLGSIQVTINKIEQPANIRERYSAYEAPESDTLEGEKLTTFIQKQLKATQGYILLEQLKQLSSILSPTSLREPPSGVY
ncbi:MAG: CRISPR-associated protein [Synechococcaceae cyanobacterium SM2_3_2]|nr:CRISPR-associated protein [Synechococcaceae cyanobacterium SM2_3_2]